MDSYVVSSNDHKHQDQSHSPWLLAADTADMKVSDGLPERPWPQVSTARDFMARFRIVCEIERKCISAAEDENEEKSEMHYGDKA